LLPAWRQLAHITLAVAVVLLSACSRPTPVVIVAVDALRADHLSSYGYHREADKAVTGYMNESVVFLRAFTPWPRTTAAFSSLMTGRYPYRHGVKHLGQALPEQNVTLAELLASKGYATAGFVSSTVMISGLSDLDQGFEVWDDIMPSREDNRDNYERKAEQTVDAAIEWLKDAPRKMFLFVHLIDPHGPYSAPGDYGSRYTSVVGRPMEPGSVPRFQKLEGADTIEDYVDAYDSEIAYTMEHVERLFDALRDEGVYDRALIMMTADHGESLGEHGSFFRHGETLNDPSVRVPLVIKAPGGRSAEVPPRYGAAVSLVDMLPTVADFLELGRPVKWDGRSLKGAVLGQVPRRTRVVFSSRVVPGQPARWGVHRADGSLLVEGCPGKIDNRRDECSVAYFNSRLDPSQVRPIRHGPRVEQLQRKVTWFRKKASSYELPFEVERRYRPSQKGFVKDFVARHNEARQGPTPDQLDGLRSLGYLE
jgi:arylsulfatase A-like enzyme